MKKDKDEFEEIFKSMNANRAFIYAEYKSRWVEAIAEKRHDSIWYFFFSDPNNAMMAECIGGVVMAKLPPELSN